MEACKPENTIIPTMKYEGGSSGARTFQKTMTLNTPPNLLQRGFRTTKSVFWSPQSPDLNPVENLWAELTCVCVCVCVV